MKKTIIFILSILLFMPIFVLADKSFIDGQKIANDYIYSLPRYSRYLVNSDNMKFGFDSTGVIKANGFNTGGFLNELEFTRSRKDNASWLAPGIQYWLADSGNKALDLEVRSGVTVSGVRVTEYVKQETTVKGKGTLSSPWEFIDKFTVNIISSDRSKGIIKEPAYKHVELGATKTFTLELKGNFKPITSECENNKNGHFSVTTEGNIIKMKVSEISDDFVCTVLFDTSCNKVTFKNVKDTTNGMHDRSLYYKFENGWFSDSSCKTKATKSDIYLPTFKGYIFNSYKSGSKEIINNNKVLYHNIIDSSITNNMIANANWTPIQYTVSYNCNGGNGSTKSSTHTYDLSAKLTTNGCTRSGYKFLGWSDNSGDKNPKYLNNQSVLNLSSIQGSTYNLYAIWEKEKLDGASSCGSVIVNSNSCNGAEIRYLGYLESACLENCAGVPILNVYNSNENKINTLSSIDVSANYGYDYGEYGIALNSGESQWSLYSRTANVYYSSKKDPDVSELKVVNTNSWDVWKYNKVYLFKRDCIKNPLNISFAGRINTESIGSLGGAKLIVYDKKQGKTYKLTSNDSDIVGGQMKNYSGFGITLGVEPFRWSAYARVANMFYSTHDTDNVSDLRPLSMLEWNLGNNSDLYIYKKECIETPSNMEFIGSANTASGGGVGGAKMVAYDKKKNVSYNIMSNELMVGHSKFCTGFGINWEIEPYRWAAFATESNLYYSFRETNNKNDLRQFSIYDWNPSQNSMIYIYKKINVDTPDNMIFLGSVNTSSDSGVGGARMVVYDKTKDKSEQILSNDMQNGQMKDYSGFGITTEIEPYRWSLYSREVEIYYSLKETENMADLRPLTSFDWSMSNHGSIYIYKKIVISEPPNMSLIGDVHNASSSGSGGAKLVVYDKKQNKSFNIYSNDMLNGKMGNYTGFGVTLNIGTSKWSIYSREGGIFYSTKETNNLSDLKPLSKYELLPSSKGRIYIYKSDYIKSPNDYSYIGEVHIASTGGNGGPKAIVYDHINKKSYNIVYAGTTSIKLTDFSFALSLYGFWNLTSSNDNIYYSKKEAENESDLTKLKSINIGFSDNAKYYIYKK